MAEWACVNGQLMPADEARVSVFDSGFMQGVGLFETMRAYRVRDELPAVVFRLDKHLARLRASAEKLGWSTLPDEHELRSNVQQVVRAMGQPDVRVRLTVTTGTLRPTSDAPPALTIIATASPGGRYPDAVYKSGVTAIVSPYRQSAFDPTVGHKTTSYVSRLMSLREAHARSAFEALWFTEDGHLAEGAISNVFMISDGDLMTPPLETPVLPGITRAAVMELARAQRIAVVETELTLDDVLDADEVFLTNSVMEIVPVVRIERERIGNEKPGDMTHRLAEAFTDLLQQECADE